MRWIPRLRMLLARRPWLYWMLVAGCAVTIGAVMVSAFADVRRQRDSWGRTANVLVATRDVAAGEDIGQAFEARDVPLAVVPGSALASMPPGATATQRISTGEMIVDADVSTRRGPLALLPDGWLAIDVLRSESGLADGQPLFELGDVATVMADGTIIADEAIIVGVSADGVSIGVPRQVAARVAQAASLRTAVIALERR